MNEEIELLSEIKAFLLRHEEMPAATFGRRCLNNPNFIFDLEKGRSPTGRTVRKIRVWMKNQDTKRRKRDAAQPAL